jgi:hypothetical protein
MEWGRGQARGVEDDPDRQDATARPVERIGWATSGGDFAVVRNHPVRDRMLIWRTIAVSRNY